MWQGLLAIPTTRPWCIQPKDVECQSGSTSIDDCFPVIPVRRDRWLATFLTAEIQIPMYLLEWISKVNFPKVHPKDSSIGNRDCIFLDMNDEERQELVPDHAAMLKLSNAKYLPCWLFEDGKTALECRALGTS